jgi:hypothetical protein
MAMDQFLAEYFGNTKTAFVNDTTDAPDAEAEKTAQMELFCKLAADNGIDLDKLSEDQIATLWNATFDGYEKTAGEDDKEDEDEDGDAKKEEAARELAEKKEAMAKMAEATFLGKVMAHSLVAELREISKEASAEAEMDPGEIPEIEESKEAAMPPQLAKALDKGKYLAGKAKRYGGDAAKRVDELVTGSKAKDLKARAETAIRSAREAKERGSSTQTGWQALAKKYVPAAKSEAKKVTMTRAGLGAAGAAAAGAGAAMYAGRKKESSAIDELALVAAVEKAAEAGWDLDQAAERVAAVHTLDLLGESEKVAAAIDVDSAVDVRALEYLEAAGYPVTWES